MQKKSISIFFLMFALAISLLTPFGVRASEVDPKLQNFNEWVESVDLDDEQDLVKEHSDEKIREIRTKAKVLEDGSMWVAQKWTFDDSNTDSTEHYIVFSKSALAGIKLDNIRVSQNGTPLEEVPWDIEESFDWKAGKFGLNQTGDNLEICFGIGEEKKFNDFVVSYTVSNALEKTTDNYTFLNWKFVNDDLSDRVGKVRVDVELPANAKRIYAFGYKGYACIADDDDKRVIFENEKEPFGKKNYLVGLIELEKGMFDARETNKTRREIYEISFKGSTYKIKYIDEENRLLRERDIRDGGVNVDTSNKTKSGIDVKSSSIGGTFAKVVAVLFGGIVAVTGLSILVFKLKDKYPEFFKNVLGVLPEMKTNITKYDKETYFRDNVEIPPEEFVAPLKAEDLADFSNYTKYFITKWVNKDIILIRKEEKKQLFRTKEYDVLTFKEPDYEMNELEEIFYDFILSYTNDLNELSTIDIENKVRWDILQGKYQKLIHSKLVSETENSKYFVPIDSENPASDLVITDEAREVLIHYYGIKNFLNEFTLMDEREIKEVKLWDYHLTLAAFLGIADEVNKQLQVHPEIYETTNMSITNVAEVGFLLDTIGLSVDNGINNCATRSSGSGGSSSFGGGGGFSGGGSGGGSR